MYEWNEAIQKMIDWIEKNIAKTPSLIDMSKQIGYSPYYCSTQFHKVVGMTLKSYMAGRKLCHATLELRDTNESRGCKSCRSRLKYLIIKINISHQ